MQIRDDALRKKKVMTSDGKHIGTAHGLEFDSESYAVSTIIIHLESDIAKEIGAKKPLIGKAEISVPVKKISGITDSVVLRLDFAELKESVIES